MPSWALACKNCGKLFAHSQIGENLANFYLPEKPKFPDTGLERLCPHCNVKSMYQQQELRYWAGEGLK